MYVKSDGQMKSFRRIKLTSNSTFNLVYTATETRIKEVYKCSSDLPNHYPLRNLISSSISYLSDIASGDKDYLI